MIRPAVRALALLVALPAVASAARDVKVQLLAVNETTTPGTTSRRTCAGSSAASATRCSSPPAT